MIIEHTFELSRRKALVSLGATDITSAGAGFGTSAYFRDEEPFEDNRLTAGESNLVVNYDASGDQGNVDTQEHGENRAPRRPPSVGGTVGPTLLGHPDTQPRS